MEKQHEDVMEVPEMDGGLLVELLDTTEAAAKEEEEEAEQAGGRHGEQQLGFSADDVSDGWVDSSIHPHQEDCEDCGLDDILSNFEGCGCSPPPYDIMDPVDYWTEEMEAATGECVGEWYMDGMVMEWDDGRGYYSFYSSHGDDACTDQQYGSPLWE